MSLRICEDRPWFGSWAEKRRAEEDILRSIQFTNRMIRKRPRIQIPKDEEKALVGFREIEERGAGEDEIWAFRDGSKSGNRAGVAWVKMAGLGLEEEEVGIAVLESWDSVRMEISGIGLGI